MAETVSNEWQVDVDEILAQPRDRESMHLRMSALLQRDASLKKMYAVLQGCYEASPNADVLIDVCHAAEGLMAHKSRIVRAACALIRRDAKEQAVRILGTLKKIERPINDKNADRKYLEVCYALGERDILLDRHLPLFLKSTEGLAQSFSVLRSILRVEDVPFARRFLQTIERCEADKETIKRLRERVVHDFPALVLDLPHVKTQNCTSNLSFEEKASQMLVLLQSGHCSENNVSAAINLTVHISDEAAVRLWDVIVKCDPSKQRARERFFKKKQLSSVDKTAAEPVVTPPRTTPQKQGGPWENIPKFESIVIALPRGNEKNITDTQRHALMQLAKIAGRDGGMVRHRFNELINDLSSYKCHRDLVNDLCNLLELSINHFHRSDDNHQRWASRSGAFSRAPAKNASFDRNAAVLEEDAFKPYRHPVPKKKK